MNLIGNHRQNGKRIWLVAAYKSLTVSSDKEKTRAFLADVFSKEGKSKSLKELLRAVKDYNSQCQEWYVKLKKYKGKEAPEKSVSKNFSSCNREWKKKRTRTVMPRNHS
jgi:hypothetical protein